MLDRSLRWCIWSGPTFLVLFFTGILLAGLLPPPSPARSPQSIAAFWAAHTDVKRAGLVLMMIGAGFIAPFGMAIAVQMKKMEGVVSPMTWLQIAGAGVNVLVVVFPVIFFMAASFRPTRDPAVTQGLTDIAFIPFVVNWPPVALQSVSLAVVCLGRHSRPLFPRWLGFFSLWTVFLFLPGSLLPFFKHGVWAWDGLLSFWAVAVVFGGWFVVMTVMLLRSLRVEQAMRA